MKKKKKKQQQPQLDYVCLQRKVLKYPIFVCTIIMLRQARLFVHENVLLHYGT